MTGILATLGAPGVTLVIIGLALVLYWAARPFRPEATWAGDLMRLRSWHQTRSATHRRAPLPMPHDLWPRAEVGPLMWRWPLNSTRWVCAQLWRLVSPWRGLLGVIARLSWYQAAAIGAAAAMVQALVLMVLITLPVAVVLVVIDTTTALRGGLPPARRSHARKAAAAHHKRVAWAETRLAAVRADLTNSAPVYQGGRS